MKVIQTIYNSKDFQSRTITLDMGWNSFKEKIFIAINNGDYIKDEEVKLKTEPLLSGTLIPKTKNGIVMQEDNVHLMIRAKLFNNNTETFMFYLVEE